PCPQRAGQQCEGDEVAEHHRRVPGAPAPGGDPQGQGRGDLADHGRAQQQPAHEAASWARRARWEPSSTSTIPAAISTIPVVFRAGNASPNSTAERIAVSTTPQAAQIPYATPSAMPRRSTCARNPNDSA